MEILDKHKGLSYEAASREGKRLIDYAAQTGHWFPVIEELWSLRQVMRLTRPSPKGGHMNALEVA